MAPRLAACWFRLFIAGVPLVVLNGTPTNLLPGRQGLTAKLGVVRVAKSRLGLY